MSASSCSSSYIKINLRIHLGESQDRIFEIDGQRLFAGSTYDSIRPIIIRGCLCCPVTACVLLSFSAPCCRRRKVLPFSLMLFLASSMSHVEAAVTQVAYRNAKYLWPGFAGVCDNITTSLPILAFGWECVWVCVVGTYVREPRRISRSQEEAFSPTVLFFTRDGLLVLQ